MKKKLILLTLFFGILLINSIELEYHKIITDHYPVVNSMVDVSDNGIYQRDLKPENFEVWVKTQVPFTLKNVNIPLSIVILFDRSGSVKDYLERMKLGLEKFLDQLKPVDETMFWTFERKSYLLQDWTKSRDIIKQSYRDINAEGATFLYDALDAVIERVKGEREYTAILIISDGIDEIYEGSGNASRKTSEDIINKASEHGIPVHAIAYGPRIDREFLDFITTGTGGKFYVNPPYSMYDRIYAGIADSFAKSINITHTSPFKEWYSGKRIVEIVAKKDSKQDSKEKSYIREGIYEEIPPVTRRDEVLQLLETLPKVTIVATDRNNNLIDGEFKVLINGKVVDGGNIVKGSAAFDLKEYYFEDTFNRIPEEYEKMRKKAVMFPPEVKMLVYTTEASNQFVPLKIKLTSLDGKREYEFFTSIDGMGTNKITQDIIEGVYSLRVETGTSTILKDVVNIRKNFRLTKEYKFGRITLKKTNMLFSDKELSGLNISVLDEHGGIYLYRNTPLYKVTGGKSHFLLPPGKYRIILENSKEKDIILRGKVDFECIILGGESITAGVKMEDLAKF